MILTLVSYGIYLKELHGFIQASQLWLKKSARILHNIGYDHSINDKCVVMCSCSRILVDCNWSIYYSLSQCIKILLQLIFHFTFDSWLSNILTNLLTEWIQVIQMFLKIKSQNYWIKTRKIFHTTIATLLYFCKGARLNWYNDFC